MEGKVRLGIGSRSEMSILPPDSDAGVLADALDLREVDAIGLALLWSLVNGEPWLRLKKRLLTPVWPERLDRPWLHQLADDFTRAVASLDAADINLSSRWKECLQGFGGQDETVETLQTLLRQISDRARLACLRQQSLYLWDNQRALA
jgi:hypothetical protein